MKNLFKHIILLVAVSFIGLSGAFAQLFPVQLTPIFNSPYSVKLSDYATSMDTKMQLLINPTDISISQRQVRLKLYIQGNGLNIQSSDYMEGQRPIFINGGELQTLTNTDISALFRLENLQGITALQYANGLPEGMYSFCFEMFDYITNQRISQKSCANLYLILNDPPLLNTPQKNEQIASSDFPNILFTWTPRQMNATNISYKFELKQLIDPTLDPQFAFQMSPVLYEETLFATALLYNLNMPILTPGMRYAWRVRAISTTGLSENAVFKNDGYSEIYSFKYTASCAAPTFLLSESQSAKSVKITWEGIPEHTRYQVQYKKQDVRNAQWFSTNSLNTQSLITNLEPGVTYQFRVGSSCDPATDGIQSFTYSGISTFTTPTETNGVKAYNCGIIPQINIQNQKPLTNLIQSETFKAGDFPVTILELQGENSPYSGRGYIIVPYLGDTKIAVEFKDIVVNTDYQLISGIVETSYNPDWKNIVDVEDFTGEGQGGQIEETVPFEVKDIVINANGDILVNGINGEQITIPGGKDTVITDSKGNTYDVDKYGNRSNNPTAPAAGGKPTPENTDGVNQNGQATAFTAKGISIVFSNNEDSNNGAISKYAFDVMPNNKSNALENLYKKVDNVALPYKAVVNGNSDIVLATVSLSDANIKLDSIVFKTQNGAKIDFKRNDKVFVLTVKGNLSYAEEEILATIKQGDKWKVIGAFMLVHISPKEVNVALVPTDDVSQNKLDAVIGKTQEIYNKVGIKINFKKQDILNIDGVSGATILTDKNTITSTYSTVQQDINALYKGDGNSYVLFITNKASSREQQGYMRLNGQFGYVFQSALSKTPAHELGHGIFKLEHPFETYKTSESSTDLLMDYSEGTVLNHQDWKQINDPAFKLYAFQSQSDGEASLRNLTVITRSMSNGVYKIEPKATKGMSQQEFITYIRSLWKGFLLCVKKDQNHEWVKGFEKYTLGYANPCEMKNGYYGKETGILFIDITTEAPFYKIYYFDDEKEAYPYMYGRKNTLVFVNGYRFKPSLSLDEYEDSENTIRTTAIDDYWEGIDYLFMKRLYPKSVWYADGHHSIKTSNHAEMGTFTKSMAGSNCAKGGVINILAGVNAISTVACTSCYHNNSCVALSTTTNAVGFTRRRNNGKLAVIDLIKELKKAKFDKATEKVDIVAHSMGYAYSLGMIDELKKQGYKLGRFYILAPENASSGSVTLTDFENKEVWQYGSSEDNLKDKKWFQDGVAPQGPIGNIGTRRVYIPEDGSVPQGFLDSHSISNYKWIFTKQEGDAGYVKSR